MRQLFHAAGARAHITFTVSRELGSLTVFESWGGAGPEAAKHANAAIRQDLDAHGNEALAVARAADRAADGIEAVQSQLHRLRADAAELQLEVNPDTSRLERTPEKIAALQTRLDVPSEYAAPVHAAIAVGNPDTATDVTVTVPGIGSTTKDTLPGMVTDTATPDRSGSPSWRTACVPSRRSRPRNASTALR